MILAFTEEQKKEIEVREMTVIEFKRRIYRMEKTVDDAWQVLREVADGVKLVFEKINEAYHYPTSRRYQIAKVFSKCTGTDISFGWMINWKIKRWLARSCC